MSNKSPRNNGRPKRNSRTPLIFALTLFMIFLVLLFLWGDEVKQVAETIKQTFVGGEFASDAGDDVIDLGVPIDEAQPDVNEIQEQAELSPGDEIADTGADLDDSIGDNNQDAVIADDEITLETCLATPEMYQVIFDDVTRESGESHELCKGAFTLVNLGDERLHFRLHLINEPTDRIPESWLERRLSPGESLVVAGFHYGTSTTVNGTTLDFSTYPEIIVVKATSECVALISDDLRAQWEPSAVWLDDPCYAP